MLVKTRGVVLKFIKYRETSIIVNIYTESLGIQSYLVNGIRSVRSKKNKIALYQPLTMLDLVVYYREEKQLHRLSEAKCRHPFQSITLNPKKSAIALFLVEVLGKTLKEQTENKPLFNFIWDTILQFDEEGPYPECFHLVFVIKLARHMGFAPDRALEVYEELRNELGSQWLNTIEYQLMDQLLKCDFQNTPRLNSSQRKKLLRVLLSLFQLHVEHFGTIKSVKVLNQVFS